jgi:DMSO/TMAO reductase YedYZ molybdopterin-dependent catalytic subunit
MKLRNLVTGAIFGLVLTVPLIAVMYLAEALAGLPFAPFDLFNWFSRLLPGPVITFGIDLMIDTLLFFGISVADTAKLAEQSMAIGMFLFAGILAGIVFMLVAGLRKMRLSVLDGIVLGLLFGLPIAAISSGVSDTKVHPALGFAWLAALFVIWGVALAWAQRGDLATSGQSAPTAEVEEHKVERINRRQFLITLGGSAAAITVAGTGLGAVLATAERRRKQQILDDTMAHQSGGGEQRSFPNADDPVVPAPGTRPEYTPLKDHYKVFIELEPTEIDGASWHLPITGLVDNPLMLTIDDLRDNYTRRDQYVTISCISGRIGTSLIGTTLWSGISLQEILDDVGVQPDARYLHITSGDGFYETIDLDLIAQDERIMLCYSWDGNPLPVDHGFPLRVWIPDRYGMKQPKWITGMELIADYTEGFWVERGWDEVAQVKTTSVIDTVAVDAVIRSGTQRVIPVGGIAFSGDRGISKVEVRVDGGEWQQAQLRSPLSETTWVIWRYEWPFQEGDHLFEVRCAEGDGTPQIEEQSDARPSGSTGIHSVEAQV